MKTLTLVLLMLFSASALAFDETPRADARQDRQSARIAQGVDSGALTVPEARGLARQQVSIHRAEHRFESDGVVTRGERARLEARQDRASRSIFRQKQDRQRRGW